jgi:hypothetical protein
MVTCKKTNTRLFQIFQHLESRHSFEYWFLSQYRVNLPLLLFLLSGFVNNNFRICLNYYFQFIITRMYVLLHIVETRQLYIFHVTTFVFWLACPVCSKRAYFIYCKKKKIKIYCAHHKHKEVTV